jgi:hypothetical protein
MLFATDIVEQVVAEIEDVPRRQISSVLSETIDHQIALYRDRGSQHGRLRFTGPTLAKFRREFGPLAVAVCNETSGNSENALSKRWYPRIVELVWTALCSNYQSRFAAGVCMFGFGEAELLPQLVVEEFDGCCNGGLRSIDLQIAPITQQNSAGIFPFADREVMHSFMEGVNRRTRFMFNVLIELSMHELAERIVKDNFTLSAQQLAVVKAINDKTITAMMEKFTANIDSWIMAESIGPIVDVVSGMPKEEIAALAEALVEVTAARSKVMDAVESVGGDVDVCVVTKGDGLIWIKRKHYFDLGKNQQYLRRRFSYAASSGDEK